MVREIFVNRSGVLTKVGPGKIWVKRGDRLRPVVAVYLKRGTGLLTYWDYIPGIPGGFQKTAQDFNSVTVKWNGVTGAERYHVLQRTGTAKFGDQSTVVGNLGVNARSFKVPNLKKNSTYIITVRAVSLFWGEAIEGPESVPLKVFTGIRAVEEKGDSGHKEGGDFTNFYTHPAHKADTYTKAHDWKGDKNNQKVSQGTYDHSNNDNRNQYGCVDYSTIYNTLQNRHGTCDIVRGDPPKTTKRWIADFIVIDEAKVETISRPKDSGGSEHPNLRFNNGDFSMGSNNVPHLPGDPKADVEAPKQGASKATPIAINKIWVDQWARPPGSRTANGIVVHRGDGGQYCVLTGVGSGKDWDLKLKYHWNIDLELETPHYTRAYTWPGGTVP